MVTLGESLFVTTVLAGVALCVLGYYCYRTWNEPGVGAFAAFLTILGGGGGVVGGAVGLVGGSDVGGVTMPLWADIAFLSWGVAMVPWLVFAFQYTGKYTKVRWRTIGLLALPVVGIAVIAVASATGWTDYAVLLNVVGTLAVIHVLFLMIIGIYLVIRTTHEYGHLSLVEGVSVANAAFVSFLGINVASIVASDGTAIAAVSAFTAAFALPAVGVAIAVFGYDMFTTVPAAGTVGEQAIARETDDLVFVVDEHGRLVKLNRTAAELLDVTQREPLGDTFAECLDVSIDTLRGMETFELQTTIGRRQFDPEVSTFTDQHDRKLGYIVSLHDVTERELRKQRLAVLNRVLRHNLRNNVDVIKSNAEELADEHENGYAETIIESANGLADVGKKARSIDRFVSREVKEGEQDLATVIPEVIAEARRRASRNSDMSVTVDCPASAPLVTDWEALDAALESAIENAIEHAEEAVEITVDEYTTGYRVTVADDGPGIPDSELETLHAGTETQLQHGSGLGLWQLKWGVTKFNGTLSFENTDGTTVRMTVPDQSAA
jgi:signal transduction histidine kinase